MPARSADSTTVAGPELLAPAGEPRALRAALSAGADAVYFGLERWSARAFAGNFGGEAAPEAVELAHRYGARAYLALNTQLKEDEVEPALGALEAPYRAGLDALIVADLGYAARVREEYPGLPLHASTQVNTQSSAQLAALARLGFARAILARELSLDEIAALETHGLELEAFVHGALCYGYSGDCLLSSMVGGRSGNRGRCSQACRLRYVLRREGSAAREPSRILSTSDLAAIDLLPKLLAAGVTSFKIEGRMKDAAYVGVTTAVYREALDAAVDDPAAFAVRAEWRARLEQSFSRSFTTAHLEGRHDQVRSGGRGGHRGVLVGRVSAVDENTGEVEIRLSKPVAAGDVVYLYTPWGQTEPGRLEEGGQDRIALRVRERVALKDRLFRLAAADVGELARDLVAGRVALRPIDVTMRLSGALGAPAELTVAEVRSGESLTVATDEPLTAARTAALTEERVAAAVGALGGTPYRLARLEYAVEGAVFLGVGDLKRLRRRALAALDERRVGAGHRAAGRRAPGDQKPAMCDERPARERLAGRRRLGEAGRIILRLRPEEAPLPLPSGGAYCLDVLAGDDPAVVARAFETLRALGSPVRLRLPEVLFDTDASWAEELLAPAWSAVVVRAAGQLCGVAGAYVVEQPLQGLNSLTARVATLLAGRPPAALTVSPEMSLAEIPSFAGGLAGVMPERPPALEILAFGRQQVLRTRDLLGYAEGLYEAPAPHHQVSLALEDAKGYVFPAEVDVGGTRIFNARVTNLTANLGELREVGITGLIVEQSAMDRAERAAFAAGGLEALAPLASRERSTTGHLFRGVT